MGDGAPLKYFGPWLFFECSRSLIQQEERHDRTRCMAVGICKWSPSHLELVVARKMLRRSRKLVHEL